MKKIKTYWWFWGMIPIFLFLGFIYADSQLNIPNEKWSSAFPINYNGIYISMFLLFSGFGYLIKKERLNKKLSVLHFISTVFGLFILVLPKLIFLIFSSQTSRRYYSSTISPSFCEYLNEVNFLNLFAIVLIILGIITYFINLGIAIFKHKT